MEALSMLYFRQYNFSTKTFQLFLSVPFSVCVWVYVCVAVKVVLWTIAIVISFSPLSNWHIALSCIGVYISTRGHCTYAFMHLHWYDCEGKLQQL